MPVPEKIEKTELEVDEGARGSFGRKRAVYIDILRIFACLFVIFNHTSSRGFLRYVSDVSGSFRWIASVFFATFCKTVPLFLMLSGALLLGRDEPIGKTLRRSVRILIDCVLFSILFYWIDSNNAGTAFSLKDTLQRILGGSYGHLWYLDVYVGFILSVPIIRKFVISLDEKTCVYTLVLASVILGVVPIIETFWTVPVNGWFKCGWLTSYIVIYPVTGYMIEHKLKVTKRTVYQLWEIVCLCFVITCICEYCLQQREPGNGSETFIQSFWLVNNMTIFITAKYVFENKKFGDKTYKILTEIGACTYGIYIFHPAFLWNVPVLLDVWTKIESIGYMGVFITCICVFALAGMITWLLRRIPIIRKLL